MYELSRKLFVTTKGMWRKVFVGLFQRKATFRKRRGLDKTMKRECLHRREEEIKHKCNKKKKTALYQKW